MIIEIESACGDCFLRGGKVSLHELNDRMKDVLNDTDEKDFVPLFCARYGYERINLPENCTADFLLDLDIHKIYVPIMSIKNKN